MTAATLAYLARLGAWTLAASLVVGALAWASWRLWTWSTTGQASEARHRLACLHLILLAPATVTAAVLLHVTALDMAAARGIAIAAPAPGGGGPGLDGAGWIGVAAAAVWSAGAVAMAWRLALDAWRTRGAVTAAPPDGLTARVARLAARAGMRRPRVRIAAVATPQVVGLRRPELHLPAGSWRRLPVAEFDALVLHELAHLRRGDFAWNLAQRAVLTLMWFHPAAWSLYGAIAREREACCDALAVRSGARPTDLARALVRLAEARPTQAAALAASGGVLAERLERLLATSAAPPARNLPGAAAAAALMLAAPLTGLLGAVDPNLGALCNASALAPTVTIAAHDPAGVFDLHIRSGRVIDASVDRLRVPPGRILQYADRIVLAGPRSEALVTVALTPEGGIRWTPRTPA